jgi:hypothetical protein
MSEALDNGLPPWQSDARPDRRAAEEDRAWAQLYASVGQAATAEEVVRQLDGDAQARHSHLALYLRARTTLRERKLAEVRNQRIGAVARSVVAWLVIDPLHLLRSVLRSVLWSGTDVALQVLAPARRDPARVRVTALSRDPEFASAAERFTAATQDRPAVARQNEESRGAKAA